MTESKRNVLCWMVLLYSVSTNLYLIANANRMHLICLLGMFAFANISAGALMDMVFSVRYEHRRKGKRKDE